MCVGPASTHGGHLIFPCIFLHHYFVFPFSGSPHRLALCSCFLVSSPPISQQTFICPPQSSAFFPSPWMPLPKVWLICGVALRAGPDWSKLGGGVVNLLKSSLGESLVNLPLLKDISVEGEVGSFLGPFQSPSPLLFLSPPSPQLCFTEIKS